MEVKVRKNQYNHLVADCPFCPHWAYVRDVTKTNPDPLRSLKLHIANTAKNEAFRAALDEGNKVVHKHLDYYKEHSRPKVVPVPNKREFDDDLKPV